MAGFCDNHCMHFDGEKCVHPTYPKIKKFFKEDGVRCGDFKGTPGINDWETYRNNLKEKRKEKRREKREEEKRIEQEKLEQSLAILRESNIEKREGLEHYFKLEPIEQFYLMETIVHKRNNKEVMKEVYDLEGRPIPPSGVSGRINNWNLIPRISRARDELVNIIALKTKHELDMIMDDMVVKLKDAVATIDLDNTLPEDVIKMTKDVADIVNKIKPKETNVHVGDNTVVFADGTTLKDIYDNNKIQKEVIVVEANYEER